MGKFDSSKTRTVPIFDQLYVRDKTGQSWLRKLISFPVGGNPASWAANSDLTIQDLGWGVREKQLNPPVALLSWLIRHPRSPVSGGLSSDPVKAQKRAEWLAGSEASMSEGLALLRDSPKREDWHIFEGRTQPDVFIQTPDIVVVIEGKRTERKPTTATKWMAGRHQMLRHLDCAWEIRGRRKVIGFFIVEGHGDQCDVPAIWLDYATQTVAPAAVESSLPHRGPAEQRRIAAALPA